MKIFFFYLERNIIDFSTIREMLIHLIYDVIIPVSLQIDCILIDKTLQSQSSCFLIQFHIFYFIYCTLHFCMYLFSFHLENPFDDDKFLSSSTDRDSSFRFGKISMFVRLAEDEEDAARISINGVQKRRRRAWLEPLTLVAHEL